MCAEAGIEPIVTTTAQWGDEMGKTADVTCCSPEDMQVHLILLISHRFCARPVHILVLSCLYVSLKLVSLIVVVQGGSDRVCIR